MELPMGGGAGKLRLGSVHALAGRGGAGERRRGARRGAVAAACQDSVLLDAPPPLLHPSGEGGAQPLLLERLVLLWQYSGSTGCTSWAAATPAL